MRERLVMHARARRGAAYLVALAGAATVAAMLVGGAMALRVHRAESQGIIEPGRARLVAVSGLEFAAHVVMKDEAWRDGAGENWVSMDVGAARVRVEVTGPDGGALEDTEPATLRATAELGQSRQVYAAETSVRDTTPDSMQNTVMAGSALTLVADLTAEGISACNGTTTVLLARLHGDLETNLLLGNRVNGDVTTGVTHDMPDPDDVIDAPILFSTIPSGSVAKKLFSPAHNPFGVSVNPQGVYVIDCGGRAIIIECTRVLGTLVILDPGFGSKITGPMLVEPAESGLASIVVRGSMVFDVETTDVLRETTLSTNFNPAGAPFAGSSDADTADVYSPWLKGMIYATGNLSFDGAMTNSTTRGYLGAIFAGGTISINNVMEVEWDSGLESNPPLGFASHFERLATTGVRREAASP
jgi:hypothetical protein